MSSRPRRVAAQAADIARRSSSARNSAGTARKAVTASSDGESTAKDSDAEALGNGESGARPHGKGEGVELAGAAVGSYAGGGAGRAVTKGRSKRTAAATAPYVDDTDIAPTAKRAKKAQPSSLSTSKPSNPSIALPPTALPAPAPAPAPAHTNGTTNPPHLPPPTLLPPTLSFSLPHAITHLSAADPRFGNMFTHVPIKPFAPPLEAIDPFRTLVTSIIGQQVSWMAARAINARFRALFGYGVKREQGEGESGRGAEGEEGEGEGEGEGGEGGGGGEGGYPTPREVMGKEVLELKSVGLSLRKAEYVRSLAEDFHSGALTTELLRDGTDEEVSKALIAVRGIGQWTVDMFLMFSLRRPDILPVGDLGVQKGLLRWFLAAHGALPVPTRTAAAGKGKGKGKGKEEVKGEDGEAILGSGKKGGKAAEAARKKYAPAPTPTPARARGLGVDVKVELQDEAVIGGEERARRMQTPPGTMNGRDGGEVQGELDTLIVTPRSGNTSASETDERHGGVNRTSIIDRGKTRSALPPTPLTPGNGTNTDSANDSHKDTPDSTADSASSRDAHVKTGVLHATVTPIWGLNGTAQALPRLPPTPRSPGPSRARSDHLAPWHVPSQSTAQADVGGSGERQVVPDETLEIPSSALPPSSVPVHGPDRASGPAAGTEPGFEAAPAFDESTEPALSGDQLLHPPMQDQLSRIAQGATWDPHAAAPLEGGLSVEVLKARLSGKKVKGGAYLTPDEMQRMTEHWKPYRSLGVYYMWPAGEEF